MSEKVKFQVKDKVFAKVRGYSPWPAMITGVKDNSPQNKYIVHFYGTRQRAECKAKDIFSYEENKFSLGKPKKRRKNLFSKALLEIETDDGNIFFPKDKIQVTPGNTSNLEPEANFEMNHKML